MYRALIPILTAVLVFAIAGSFAQTPQGTQAPPQPQTPGGAIFTPKADRTTADPATRAEMARKRSELKQKKADCRKQARAQKLHLAKRSRFIRQCMRG